MKKRIYYSTTGEKFVFRTYHELAKFVIFLVDTGKVEIRGRRPRIHERSPIVKKLLEIKEKFYADGSTVPK